MVKTLVKRTLELELESERYVKELSKSVPSLKKSEFVALFGTPQRFLIGGSLPAAMLTYTFYNTEYRGV